VHFGFWGARGEGREGRREEKDGGKRNKKVEKKREWKAIVGERG
jgi:hypothetical protein